ncbi:hypothetical protein [Falsihalocynthiibacter arcticus]|uniref:hypothetical protein n=1 Tax=Falsihalocynthiibacter arcticus TaxID=1579316 RepID=UPI0030022C1C
MGLKLLVIGDGGHGKDTAAELLAAALGLSACSSSAFAAQRAVFPLVADLYPDWRTAYADRHNHRALWFHAIRAFNLRPGPGLAAQLLDRFDIYTGMRARLEFESARHLFDLVLWVEAGARVPREPGASMELSAADADLVLDNSGDLPALARGVAAFASGRWP